jgi:hypothetical protein
MLRRTPVAIWLQDYGRIGAGGDAHAQPGDEARTCRAGTLDLSPCRPDLDSVARLCRERDRARRPRRTDRLSPQLGGGPLRLQPLGGYRRRPASAHAILYAGNFGRAQGLDAVIEAPTAGAILRRRCTGC